MSYWWLSFAVFLYIVCSALIIAEVFVPSGGLISIVALICLGVGVGIFFKQSTTVGIIGIIVAIVMIPSSVICAYKMFPRTRFGRAVILSRPERDAGDAIRDTVDLKGLLGAAGVVLTPLRPVGTCDFSGKRYECVAESGFVEKNKTVKVIHVEGTQLTVRVVETG